MGYDVQGKDFFFQFPPSTSKRSLFVGLYAVIIIRSNSLTIFLQRTRFCLFIHIFFGLFVLCCLSVTFVHPPFDGFRRYLIHGVRSRVSDPPRKGRFGVKPQAKTCSCQFYAATWRIKQKCDFALYEITVVLVISLANVMHAYMHSLQAVPIDPNNCDLLQDI